VAIPTADWRAEHTNTVRLPPQDAVRLSASLTVPNLFKVHTVHIGTLESGCLKDCNVSEWIAEGRRRGLSNVADPCARLIAVAVEFCIVGEMCLL
jgi:hypothetical protein